MTHMKKGFLLSALAFMLLGLALLLWPEASLRLVCYLFGAVILVKGLLSIWGYVRAEERFFFDYFGVVFGVAASALGVFLLFQPDTVVSVLPILVGVYVIVDAVVRLQSAFELKAMGYARWWSFLVLAGLSAALGVLMVVNPFKTVQLLVMAIGVILLVEGALSLISAVYAAVLVRGLERTAKDAARQLDKLTETLDGRPAPGSGRPVDVDYKDLSDEDR